MNRSLSLGGLLRRPEAGALLGLVAVLVFFSLVLFFAALVLAIAGANQLRKAYKCSFLARLEGPAQAPIVKWRPSAVS